MFNQGQFNEAAFNFGTETETIYLACSAGETIYGEFATSSITYLVSNAPETTLNMSELLRGFVLSEAATEGVGFTGAMLGEIKLSCGAQERIEKTCALASSISVSCDAQESVSERGRLAAAYYLTGSAMESVTAVVILAAVYYVAAEAYEIIAAAADAESVTILTMLLDVALAQGDVLVVDSDNYIVLKNGNSAIETHSGDWCWIDRRVLKVEVSGGLDASIVYQERYL